MPNGFHLLHAISRLIVTVFETQRSHKTGTRSRASKSVGRAIVVGMHHHGSKLGEREVEREVILAVWCCKGLSSKEVWCKAIEFLLTRVFFLVLFVC